MFPELIALNQITKRNSRLLKHYCNALGKN